MKRLAVLLLAGAALWMFYNDGGDSLEASHLDGQAPEQAPGDFLWSRLEPSGDGHITYWTCASNVPSQWITGVEVEWDDVTPWQFDGVVSCAAQVVLRWEAPPTLKCDDSNAVACTTLNSLFFHGDHYDISAAQILFDVDGPHPYLSWLNNWRISHVAHEWGHVMDLADHPGLECDEGTLMGQYDATKKETDNPCFTGPAPGDLSSVLCVYKRVCHTAGIWRSAAWHLRYSNSTGAGDISFPYGDSTDMALPGNWDFDGKETAGVYRPSTRQFLLSNDNSNVAINVTFGNNGDLPLAGDWDGDGDETIGVYRPSTRQFFLTNDNANTAITATYGNPEDMPLGGDWDADGDDTIGLYRPSTAQFFLSNNNSTTAVSVIYGNPGDTPIVGDWNADRRDTLGVWRSTSWYLRNSNTAGAAEILFSYGLTADKPLVGDWR